MKKVFLTLCAAAALTAAFCGAHVQNDPQKIAGPHAAFETTRHDFGNVPHKTKEIECRFVFTNDGSEPLVVTRTQTSCSCVKASFPKKPIPPGGRGEIVVTYEVSKKESGVFRKIVDVYSNAPEKRHSLIINGNAVE